jgi:hypothetical protein
MAFDVLGGDTSALGVGGELLKGVAYAKFAGFGAKYLGGVVKSQGKLLSNVATEIASGERKGASVFLESADRLERSVEKLRKEGAKQAQINPILADAKLLRIAHSMGLEKPLTEMAVITYQGTLGAATGATLAYLNNEQAASAGAGFGFGGAMIAGAAAKLGTMMPKGVQANRDMTVMANSLYVLNKRSAKERALFYEAFEREVGVNPDGSFKNREKGLRMLESLAILDGGMMGAFEIIREGELVGKTIGMQHTGINVDAVKTLAGQMYPNDAAMAANYAESLIQRANFQNNQAAKVAALNGQISKNSDAIAFAEKNLGKKREALVLAEQSQNAKRIAELKSEISQAETNVEVLKRENEKFSSESTLERSRLVDREAITRDADSRGLKGQERADFIETEALRKASELDPIRPGELRAGTNGTSIRQIADGVFINDAQGGKVYINADRTTALTMVHEAFEGILRDDAMKAAMPELVDFMYAPPGSGKRTLSDANRQRFFDLYASDLDPKLAKSYLEQLKNAEKLYADTGDFSALLPYVQEATAWWLSVIHDSRPIGYAPGISTPRGQEAPRPRIFDKLFQGTDKGRSAPRRMYDLLMGERSMTELAADAATSGADVAGAGALAEWMAFIDPDMGWLGARTRSIIRGRLESNGFSMLEGSDGTVRGFFREDGVIQRGFILDDMYEAMARNLGGVNGVRRANFDPFSDPRVPEAVKVEWAEQNGLGHLVNRPEDGGAPTIKTPEEIGQVSQQINETIRETIATVEPGQTGLETRIEGDNTVVTGKPTEADINAIKNNQNLPPNIRDNLVAVMEAAAAGNTNYVLRGRYVNVGTRQKGVGTEARLVVPRDTGGPVSEEKEFLPLGFIFGMSDMVPGGQKLPSKVPTVRVVGFDMKAAKGNLLNIRNKGLYDREGNIVTASDGKALTPDRFRELFPTDAQYWNAVNAYTSHLMAAGYIDPKNNRPVMPANMEPSAVVMARLAGDSTNIKLGEAMRDAVRFGLGIDNRKDLVLIHPAPYKKVLRDINQTISDLRLDGLGKLTTTGEQFPINASVIAWSQANMAPSTWTKLPEQALASIKDGGNGWVGQSAVAHPNTNYVIVQDTRPVEGGKQEVRFRIYDEKGALVENTAKNIKEARDAVRSKLATDESNSQLADVVAQFAREEVAAAEAAATKLAAEADFQPTPVTREGPEQSNQAALKEEQARNDARAKKIAAAARRIIKEREIKFNREQNEQIDVQRKWEEEAARRAAGERQAEAQAQKDAYDAAARQRTIDNEAGKKFKLPSEQLSLAERYYLGENVKLNKALADIDKTAPGLVNLQKMLQTPMTELGVEVRNVGMVEAGLPIYRKAFMFNKRSLSKVPLDVAAARGALPEVADAMSLGRAKADFQAGQEYMLSNAMGQIIVSNLRRVQGQTPVRYFTVYSAGMKTKIAETQDFRAAMEAMLSEAYRLNSEELMRQTQISTQAVVGLAKKVEEKAKKREPLAPSVIQRYR